MGTSKLIVQKSQTS